VGETSFVDDQGDGIPMNMEIWVTCGSINNQGKNEFFINNFRNMRLPEGELNG
jgi:hypothetical protein